MAVTAGTLRLSGVERKRYAEDGYIVRERVFEANDLARIRDAAEELCADVQARYSDARQERGGYVFSVDPTTALLVKWEGHGDAILGLEHFLDRSAVIHEYAYDPRLVEPMKEIIDAEDINIYTDKLNMKRAHEGGPIPSHQDLPYWQGSADDLDHLATVGVYLDDTTTANGCLLFARGSHKLGLLETKDPESGDRTIDDAAFPADSMVPIEAPAGSIVMFSSLLVHRSLNNTSDRDRRALLFTYQPAGLRTSAEFRKERDRRATGA